MIQRRWVRFEVDETGIREVPYGPPSATARWRQPLHPVQTIQICPRPGLSSRRVGLGSHPSVRSFPPGVGVPEFELGVCSACALALLTCDFAATTIDVRSSHGQRGCRVTPEESAEHRLMGALSRRSWKRTPRESHPTRQLFSRAGVRTVAACSLYSHKAGDRPPPAYAKPSGVPSWRSFCLSIANPRRAAPSRRLTKCRLCRRVGTHGCRSSARRLCPEATD